MLGGFSRDEEGCGAKGRIIEAIRTVKSPSPHGVLGSYVSQEVVSESEEADRELELNGRSMQVAVVQLIR